MCLWSWCDCPLQIQYQFVSESILRAYEGISHCLGNSCVFTNTRHNSIHRDCESYSNTVTVIFLW